MADKEPIKDPKGGLTAAGRAHFKRKEGANLKPGVKGPADTPEKMRRKGSFLTRFFTNPSGPMTNDKGEPTRLALSAAAWGEPVPKNRSDAAKLAAKGRRLLERYEKVKKHGGSSHDQKTHGRRKTATGSGESESSTQKLVRAAGQKARQLKTLAKKGGFTYNPKTNKVVEKGYVSAIDKKYEAKVPASKFSVKDIRAYARKHADILSLPGHHLGAWRETVDGEDLIFLDVSVVTPTIEEAADIGRKYDQLGIFDLNTFTQHDGYKNPDGKVVYMAMKPYMEGMYEMGKADKKSGKDSVMFVPGTALDERSLEKIVARLMGDEDSSKESRKNS